MPSVVRRRLLAACVAAAASTAAVAQGVAVPFTETFDGPWPVAGWNLGGSGPGPGRITVRAPSAALPASPQGGPYLALDAGINGIYAVNDLVLTADLAATGGARLLYRAREVDDEPDAGIDGCFVRPDAATPWLQVVDHTSLSDVWTEFVVDLQALAAEKGWTWTATSEIRFSQRDNFQTPGDGLLLDDVRLAPPLPSDVGQANGPLARLLVPGALNAASQPAYDGLRGPFFVATAPGAPFPFVVEGEANRPWILVAGPMHRNALVVDGVGSIDLGVAAGDLLTGFVVVLDGTAPGFLNALASTGPFGSASMLLATPPGTGGWSFALQAAVFHAGGLRATAAVEVFL